MKPLTPRQAEVFGVIRSSIAERGYAPTIREIGASIGSTGYGNVHRLVCELEDRGYIRTAIGKARAITVINHPENAVARP